MKVLVGVVTNSSTFSVLCWWSADRENLPGLLSVARFAARAIGTGRVYIEAYDYSFASGVMKLLSLQRAIYTGFRFEIDIDVEASGDIGVGKRLWMSWPNRIVVATPFDEEGEGCYLETRKIHSSDATRYYINLVISDHWYEKRCQILSSLICQGIQDGLLPSSAEFVRMHVCERMSWEEILRRYQGSHIEWMGKQWDFYFGKLDFPPCMVGIRTVFAQECRTDLGVLPQFRHAEVVWEDMRSGKLPASVVLLENQEIEDNYP